MFKSSLGKAQKLRLNVPERLYLEATERRSEGTTRIRNSDRPAPVGTVYGMN
jgi:hypothetical protein